MEGPYPVAPYPIAPTYAAQLSDFDFHVDRVASEIFEQMPVAQDATVIGESYEPSTGSVSVQFGDTNSILPDDTPPDSLIVYPKLPQLVPFPGFQYGPTGVERVVCVPSPSGFGVLYKSFSDDSPNAPAGEVHLLHKNKASQSLPNAIYDGGMKLKNDAAAAGDGLGSSQLGNQGAVTQLTTKAQNTVTCNDPNKFVSVATPGGLVTMASDTAAAITHAVGQTGFNPLTGSGFSPTIYSQIASNGGVGMISHVVQSGGLIGLGTGLASGLPTSAGAINNAILVQFAQNIQQMVGNALQQAAEAAITASVPNAAAWLSTIQGGLPSLSFTNLLSSIASLTTPAGSSLVRIQTS